MKLVNKKQKDTFKRLIPFVAEYKNLGEQYIVSAKVHLDESTPHMHIVFIPVVHKLDVKSGKIIDKIACSEFWKGKDSYKKLQDSFYKYISEKGFNLERGKSIGAEHLSTEKLKQITEYDEIKDELNTRPLQKLEKENTALILAQNNQLLLYNSKLKKHLLKTYKTIELVTKFQKELDSLKHENQKLKEQNQQLTNYIEKTFEVVKYLFNFSKENFKNIVNNFIEKMK